MGTVLSETNRRRVERLGARGSHSRKRISPIVAAVMLAAWLWPAIGDERHLDPRDQWAQWRGPLGTGVAPRGDPPVTWSENINIRWKVRIPGKGHSTPIVWGDRIFITTAIPYGDVLPARQRHAHGAHDNVPALRRQEFVVMAVSRSTMSTK